MKPAKRKTIRKVLKAKVEDWLSHLPKDVQDEVSGSIIVTGGCIVSMLKGTPINDFDIYLYNNGAAITLANYYIDQFGSDATATIQEITNIRGEAEEVVVIDVPSRGVDGKNPDEKCDSDEWLQEEQNQECETEEKYKCQFISRNAITLSNKVQIITRFTGTPEEVHKNFDFVHATCSYDYGLDNLKLPAEALESIITNELRYGGSLYPIASIFRTKKFIDRGWRVTAGELLKIMWQISEIDMTDLELMKDQLTGVDSAYMSGLIAALGTNPDKINSKYAAKIIDRIFNSEREEG